MLPASLLKPSVPTAESGLSTQQTLRFAGGAAPLSFERLGSSLDAFVPFTQAITEDFFWQFMTLDVFALWMPRIYNSLTRGRKPYRLEEDSDTASHKTNEAQQIAKIGWGTVKGLNWSYFAEEAGREFLVGPGFFTLFGIINGLYRLGINPATQLPLKALRHFTDSFGQHMQNTPGAKTAVNPTALAHMAADSLEQQWQQPQLKKALQPLLSDWKACWQAHLLEAYQYEKQVPRSQRWKNGVAYWWKTRPFQNQQVAKGISPPQARLKAAEALLDKATARLKQAVTEYNHAQPHLSYKAFHGLPVQLPQRKGASIHLTHALYDIDEWLQHAKQWHTVPLELMHQQAASTTASAMPITRQTARLLNSLTGQKLTTTLIATGIVGAYLVYLTKLFQSSKQYPGNRSRRATDLSTAQSGAA